MKKILAIAALFAATPAWADTTGAVTLGGMFTDHGNATATLDSEFVTQNGPWQGVYDLNYNYQQSHSVTTVSMGGAEVKRNYAITDRNYAIADARYDYNEFRPWQHTAIAAVGWGYKIYRDDHFKISNELTAGYRRTDFGDYAVARDSLWIRYTNGAVVAYNKFLFEKSNIDYYRNQAAIQYNLNSTLAVGVQNLYTRDVKENDITSFTLGVKF